MDLGGAINGVSTKSITIGNILNTVLFFLCGEFGVIELFSNKMALLVSFYCFRHLESTLHPQNSAPASEAICNGFFLEGNSCWDWNYVFFLLVLFTPRSSFKHQSRSYLSIIAIHFSNKHFRKYVTGKQRLKPYLSMGEYTFRWEKRWLEHNKMK